MAEQEKEAIAKTIASENVIKLTDKDLHCIARLIQSAMFSKGAFSACMFCKYEEECDTAEHSDVIRKKLMDETGVDLGVWDISLHSGAFPYRRFLKNSNEKTKVHFKKYFKEVL